VRITARRRGRSIHLEVVNSRATEAVAAPASPGHGLVGMRERAASVGGRVVAGGTADGGFRIRADLPLKPVTP
jgi:signal transduction histidine kinase